MFGVFQVEGLEKELAAAKVKASSAEKALVQHLSGFDVATPGCVDHLCLRRVDGLLLT